MVSTTGMVVSLKTDLRFPESGQQGHGAQIIQYGMNTMRYAFTDHLNYVCILKYTDLIFDVAFI